MILPSPADGASWRGPKATANSHSCRGVRPARNVHRISSAACLGVASTRATSSAVRLTRRRDAYGALEESCAYSSRSPRSTYCRIPPWR